MFKFVVQCVATNTKNDTNDMKLYYVLKVDSSQLLFTGYLYVSSVIEILAERGIGSRYNNSSTVIPNTLFYSDHCILLSHSTLLTIKVRYFQVFSAISLKHNKN